MAIIDPILDILEVTLRDASSLFSDDAISEGKVFQSFAAELAGEI